MTYYDIELIVIYTVLSLLFVLSLRPKMVIADNPLLCIDLNMSKAIKGIACIMILTAHWGQRRFSGMDDVGHISKIIWSMAASIGLVWFMFFSGYGLSLKKMKDNDLMPGWLKSLKKLYFPFLFVIIAAFVVYRFLPDTFTAEEQKELWILPEIALSKHLNIELGGGQFSRI